MASFISPVILKVQWRGKQNINKFHLFSYFFPVFAVNSYTFTICLQLSIHSFVSWILWQGKLPCSPANIHSVWLVAVKEVWRTCVISHKRNRTGIIYKISKLLREMMVKRLIIVCQRYGGHCAKLKHVVWGPRKFQGPDIIVLILRNARDLNWYNLIGARINMRLWNYYQASRKQCFLLFYFWTQPICPQIYFYGALPH